MKTWNFNMSDAPKGSYRKVQSGKGIRDVYDPQKIIAAGADGVVTVSYWMDEQNRWCMFAKDHPPIAWMEWPKNPMED